MNWWSTADLIGTLVLLPALAVTFGRLIKTLRSIAGLLVPITEDCTAIATGLAGVSRLSETEALTAAGLAGVTRCTNALAVTP